MGWIVPYKRGASQWVRHANSSPATLQICEIWRNPQRTLSFDAVSSNDELCM